MSNNISFDGTGFVIVCIMLYGFVALMRQDISFDLNISIVLILVVFILETIAGFID